MNDPSLPMVRIVTAKQSECEECNEPEPSVREIIELVGAKYGVGRLDILSARRAPKFVRARQEVMWLAFKKTTLSYPQIGRALLRDHSTCIHGVKRHQARIDSGEVMP